MDSKLKSIAVYGLFIFVAVIFLANLINKEIESYKDKLYKIDKLSEQVTSLKNKKEDLNSELEEYDSMLEEYDNSLKFYEDEITLKDEVPYTFVKNGKYEKYIYDYNRVKLYDNTELLRVKVKIKGVDNIIEFNMKMKLLYSLYYNQYLMNK